MALLARQLSNAVSLPRTSGSTAIALGSDEALNIETALQGRPVYPIRLAISAESIVPVSFGSAGSHCFTYHLTHCRQAGFRSAHFVPHQSAA